MIDIAQALSLISERAWPLPPAPTPLGDALGLVLAGDIVSDIDSPPFDKALMDGYAVIASDVHDGEADLRVLEEVTAGNAPTRSLVSGTATRIMTGAPLPSGADTVVVFEQAELIAGGVHPRVRFHHARAEPGRNIMRQGTALKRGESVLRSGRTLNAISVGIASEAGCCTVLAHPRPRVAVLATGNELVPASQAPEFGQIRNSNGPMLCALSACAGAVAVDLGIGRDDRSELAAFVERGLKEDVLVLSGGVSAGVLDLVPDVLAELGVRQVFHQVRLKPGKPLWFGVAGDDERVKLVFGLPGNPVSSFVCFQLFVRPVLGILAGNGAVALQETRARLTAPFTQHGERPLYHPGVLRLEADQRVVEPLAWHGSADLRSLSCANALVLFPAGDHRFQAGDAVSVLPFS
jgi:molybdopterin molybdotransferase